MMTPNSMCVCFKLTYYVYIMSPSIGYGGLRNCIQIGEEGIAI